MSIRLVALITFIAVSCVNMFLGHGPTLILSSLLDPSICSNIVLCTSRSSLLSESNLFVSIVSLVPLPVNICASEGPASFKKHEFVEGAHVRARRGFTVPDGYE